MNTPPEQPSPQQPCAPQPPTILDATHQPYTIYETGHGPLDKIVWLAMRDVRVHAVNGDLKIELPQHVVEAIVKLHDQEKFHWQKLGLN